MAFAHTRQQGNKKDSAQQKPHQSRGNNKKHASTNVATNRGSAKESPEEAEMARHLHDRMLFLLACLTGSVVQVTVKGGAKFEGVFHGASTEGDIGVALKHARKIYDPAAPPSEKQKSNPYPVKNSILFMGKDVVEIVSMETDLTAGDAPLPEKDTFKTDADISGRTEIKERELHKWNPETHDGEHFETLEGDSEMTSNGEAWDQFAANEKLFGLKTDFDEEIYTTRLDRNAPDFKDREKWAIEKANEIQRSAATNVHVLEERGLAVDDSEMDEEDRYGAVVRDNNNNNANKYMPPALRKQAPSTKKEGEGVRSGNPLQNLMTSNLPKAVVTAPSPVTNLPNARQEAGASFTNAAGEKPGEAHSAKRIEAEIAKTFRQFAMQEKDKLHAKKQALQKKEKEERLAELMKFHQTFKLNVPVPSDLVPLLSKGKRTSGSSSSGEKSTIPSPDTKKKSTEEQQQQQQQQQQQAQQTETKKPAATEEQPAKTEPAKTESKPAKSGFKFNVKAMEFKPNPAAPVFVPGAKPVTTSTTAAPAESERPVKKIPGKQHLTISEAFSSPFSKNKDTSPGSVRPTWPFGTQRYHDLFNQQYNGDMYPNYASPGYSYGYSTYHYPPQYVQSMSPMQMPQGAPVPYMSPQFVHNVPLTAPMPHAAAPPAVGYSPQMANVSPHGSPFPQHFHSPQRSPIIPQGVPPHQAYQYQAPAPHHGAPMMMGYPPDAAPPNMTPGLGPVMIQRPVMGEPGPMHYPQQHPEHATPNSDAQAAEASPTTR